MTPRKLPHERKGNKGLVPSERPVRDVKRSNQHVCDPRQGLFLKFYIDPTEPTFSNAYQAALKAGYKKGYAVALKSKLPAWLEEKLSSVKDAKLIGLAEENIEKCMKIDEEQPIVGMFGPVVDKEGDPVKKINTNILKIKQDTSKFVLERLDSERYGQKVKVGGDSNNPIQVKVVSVGINYELRQQ